jgi:hypothetical protein
MRVSIRHVGLIGMLSVLVLSLQPRVGSSQAAGNRQRPRNRESFLLEGHIK